MMGTQAVPDRLFYDFCLDDHVPDDHLLRRIEIGLPALIQPTVVEQGIVGNESG